MAEASGDINIKKRRRLPEWMSQSGFSSKEKQMDDTNELSQPQSVPGLETTTSEDFIVKKIHSELKKRSRISHKNVSDDAIPCSTKSSQKRPSKVDSKTICRVKKTTNTCKMKDGNKESRVRSSGENEDELDLTVDDLICIAREYVKADEEAKRVGKGTGKSTPQQISPSDFKSSSGGAFDFGASESTAAASCGSGAITKTERNSCDLFEPGNAASPSSRSGDAAQDMLDVFLGSLLKKPGHGGRKPEILAAGDMVRSCADSSKNVTPQTATFPDPLIRKPDLGDWKTEIAAADGFHWARATSNKHTVAENDGRTEAIVLEKRKSSLKDKVTMLLD